MSKAPWLTGPDLLAAKGGFVVTRIRGSHRFVRHEDGRKTVVPVHSGETIGPGLLPKILRDFRINVEDLENLLRCMIVAPLR